MEPEWEGRKLAGSKMKKNCLLTGDFNNNPD
jgi:hypothetical protein